MMHRRPVVRGGPGRRGPQAGLLVATGASVAANAMVAVLVPLLVLERTGSVVQAGLVGSAALAAAIPALLLGGPLIDRWGRRRVAVGADLLSAVAVLALPLVNTFAGLTLITVLALVALGAVFDGPGAAARESMRPMVAEAAGVSRHTLNARGEAVEGAGQVLGPALAGAGVGVVGALGSLWFAAALFVVAALATAAGPPDRRAHPPRASTRSNLAEASAGLRLVRRDPTLRGVAVLGTVAMACIAPLPLVQTARYVPAGQEESVGLVLAALAVGGVVGAVGYGRSSLRRSPCAVLMTSLALAGAGLALTALAPAPGWAALAAAGAGLAAGPVNPVLATLTQERTPPELLGRVVSTTWSLSLAASPVALAAAGLLVDVTDPVTTLLVLAAGLAVAGGYALTAPGLRRTGPRSRTAIGHPDIPQELDTPQKEVAR